MASPTHVSESEAPPSEAPPSAADKAAEAGPEDNARPTDKADKELIVLEHVVGTLLAAKKRTLAELIERDYVRMAHSPEKYAELRSLAVMRWPQLERELVRDLARALWETRSTHALCKTQLESVKLDNAVLRARLKRMTIPPLFERDLFNKCTKRKTQRKPANESRSRARAGTARRRT
jgi:hypothetical protein